MDPGPPCLEVGAHFTCSGSPGPRKLEDSASIPGTDPACCFPSVKLEVPIAFQMHSFDGSFSITAPHGHCSRLSSCREGAGPAGFISAPTYPRTICVLAYLSKRWGNLQRWQVSKETCDEGELRVVFTSTLAACKCHPPGEMAQGLQSLQCCLASQPGTHCLLPENDCFLTYTYAASTAPGMLQWLLWYRSLCNTCRR